MAKNYFFIAVCVFFLFACSNEGNVNSPLKIMGVYINNTGTYSAGQEDDSKSDTLNWCTGNDISWYNATTGELKFNRLPAYDYYTCLSGVVVFLDSMKLFSLIVYNGLLSTGHHYPCLNYLKEGAESWSVFESEYYQSKESGYYISKGYPRYGLKYRHPDVDYSMMDAVREENWKAIEPGWNLFIAQLKKEGKYRE